MSDQKFSLDEERKQLLKRKSELRYIHCELVDFNAWFLKNRSRMSSKVDLSELEDAMLVLDDILSDIEDEIDVIEDAMGKLRRFTK